MGNQRRQRLQVCGRPGVDQLPAETHTLEQLAGRLDDLGQRERRSLGGREGHLHPGGRHRLPAPVGQGADKQHRGGIDCAAHHVDLVAVQAGQRPVGHPVEHRVQRRQIVGLRPRRSGVVGERRLKQLHALRLVGRQQEPLEDAAVGQVALRQRLETLLQVAGRHELHQMLVGMLLPGDPVGAGLGLRSDEGSGQGLAQEVDGLRVQSGTRRSADDGRGLLCGGRFELGEHRRQRVAGLGDGCRVLDDVVQVGLPGEDPLDRFLLLLDRILAHQGRRVAERLVGLVLLLQQTGEDVQVAREIARRGVEQQGGDLRRGLLAVAVDAAVALLDADQ